MAIRKMRMIRLLALIFPNTFISCLLQHQFTVITIPGNLYLLCFYDNKIRLTLIKRVLQDKVDSLEVGLLEFPASCWCFILPLLYFCSILCSGIFNAIFFVSNQLIIVIIFKVFRQIGHEPMSGKALVLAVFGCMLPGTLVLLCGFFCLLHSWLNAFAEMLRFADRMFYQVIVS